MTRRSSYFLPTKFSTVNMNNDTHTMTDDMKPREYQIEMLNESLKRNIIIALDTGSGKTHIAVLRLKHEAEREPRKARTIPPSRRYLTAHATCPA